MAEAPLWQVLLPAKTDLGLRDVDLHLAHTLCELASDLRPELAAMVALLSRDVAYGHVCLPLSVVAERVSRVAVSLAGPWSALRDMSVNELEQCLRSSGLCASDTHEGPLLLVHGRLYMHRFAEHEAALAAQVLARVAHEEAPWAGLPRALERLFPMGETAFEPGNKLKEIQLDSGGQQRTAALVTTTGLLTVISGGPGTGKTSTVVKILALLCEQAQQQQQPAPRAILLAPTGKAAARLSESIAKAKASLRCAPEISAAITETAMTIHRALGLRPGSAQAKHHREHPLAADVVVVDEASMVDLVMMRRLFDAVPKAARLILLGDRDQLASVEAGAVLGDLCGAGLSEEVRENQPLARRTVTLQHSFRYRGDSGIGRLAQAIVRGDAEAAIAVLRDRRFVDVELVAPIEVTNMGLPQELVSAYEPLLQATSVDAALAQLARFRILCAHRMGPFGVSTINAFVEAALRERAVIDSDGAMYAGRPILVLRNDPWVRVYNGDVGVVFRDEASLGAELRVAFEGAAGERRVISPARLPEFESVYAMTVHKSQGSEFDEVAIVLPTEGSAVLSRELLYTAVTRARQRVVVYGLEAVVRAAIDKSAERRSGLRARLWGS